MNLERVVDVDVHHTWRSQAELLSYLPTEVREYFYGAGPDRLLPTSPAALSIFHPHGLYHRLDAIPAEGVPAGSDYSVMRDQLLDPLDIERVILSFDVGTETGHPNPLLAAALCRAANEWTVERWLDRADSRLYGAILMPAELAEEGAREIRKWAPHPRVAEALIVHTQGRPLGHPHFEPIFEAAHETGIPVAVHFAGEAHSKGRMAAGGQPATQLEKLTLLNQPAAHHVSSLITYGVFERYPRLKVIFVEMGYSWLPALAWRLDSIYHLLRRESRWVKRLPSEYLREHVRLSTQPLEDGASPAQVNEFLYSFDGMERMLCFSSDYPHHDADEPRRVARYFPREWWDGIFRDNAAELFGWRLPTV
jgi:uncharacterized protein